MSTSSDVGAVGERIAAWYLNGRGAELVASNVRVGPGEIDLLVNDRGVRVAVEVRTRIGGGDPVDAAGHDKREQVFSLAREVGAQRVDVVGIRLDGQGFDVHWVPAAI